MLSNLYQEIHTNVQCNANQLQQLYSECNNATSMSDNEPMGSAMYLQEMYQKDCKVTAVKTACSPVVPATHDCNEGYLMEMYETCAEQAQAAKGTTSSALIQLYHQNCSDTAMTQACTPKTKSQVNCDAPKLQELYNKCITGYTEDGQLQEMYDVHCTKDADVDACTPTVPTGQ